MMMNRNNVTCCLILLNRLSSFVCITNNTKLFTIEIMDNELENETYEIVPL
jgi:hypothetical protein